MSYQRSESKHCSFLFQRIVQYLHATGITELTVHHYFTSNVTGRHRGPKRKLRAGYTVPSRHWRAMCRQVIFLPAGRPRSL